MAEISHRNHQYNIQYNNTAMHIYQNISSDNILMIHNIYVHSFSLIIMILLLIRHQQTGADPGGGGGGAGVHPPYG